MQAVSARMLLSFLALLLGVLAFGLLLGACLAWFGGPELFEWVRERPVATPGAREVLARAMRRAALGGVACAVLVALAARGLATVRAALRGAGDGAPLSRGEVAAGRNALLHGALLAAGLCLFAALATGGLGRPFDYDESIEASLDLRGSLLAPVAPRAFANHPAGAWVARVGFAFAEMEAAARLPGFLLGALGLALAGWTVGTLVRSPWIGLLAPAVLLANPLVFNELFRIRGYTAFWVGCVGLLAAWVAAPRISELRTWRLASLFAGSLLAGLLLGTSHLFGFGFLGLFVGVAVVSGQHMPLGGRPLLRVPRLGESVWSAGAAVALVVSLMVWSPGLPWLDFMTGEGREPSWADQWDILFQLVGADRLLPAVLVFTTLLLGFGLAARAYAVVRVPLVAFGGGVGALFLFSVLTRPTFFLPRFMIGAVAVLLVVALAGLASHVRGRWLAALLVSIPLASTLDVPLSWPDARQAARAVDAVVTREAPGAKIQLLGGREERLVLGYYLSRERQDQVSSEAFDGSPVAWLAMARGTRAVAPGGLALASSHCRRLVPVGGPQTAFEIWLPRRGESCPVRGPI